MATTYLDPDETTLLVPSDTDQEFYLSVEQGDVRLGRSERDARSLGRRAPAGERGPLRAPKGEEVWAHNTGDVRAQLHVDRNGFIFERDPRDVLKGIIDNDGSTQPPASDSFVHAFDTGVELDSGSGGGTEAVGINPPGRADSLTIHVDGLDGAAHVAVTFGDGDGNTVTARDDSDSSDYAGDASTDIFVTVPVTSPEIVVSIIDDSGASNTADYSIYCR